MDLRETFAINLRRLRNAKGWSQDELALEAKISRSYLSQLEKGAYYVSIKIILASWRRHWVLNRRSF
jgi:transcriptional regulator with XRE-family HTH domain